MSDSGSEAGDRPLYNGNHGMDEEEENERHGRKSEQHEEGYRKGEKESDGEITGHTSPSGDGPTERTECCSACLSKNRNNKRSCICQVPAQQRRAPLGMSHTICYSADHSFILFVKGQRAV